MRSERVDGDHLGAELGRDPLGHLARPRADLEDLRRPELGDGVEDELLGLVAFDQPPVDRVPRREALLARELPPDEQRVVEPEVALGAAHGATIGVPGMPLPGARPPSQALTVAPTSPNSPFSWTRPAAFRPSTYASSNAYSRE